MGHASISSDVLASYAADAVAEVDGVAALVPSQLHRHRGVRIEESQAGVRVELHVAVAWGAFVPALGDAVERQVRGYLARMADVAPAEIEVVVDEVVGP